MKRFTLAQALVVVSVAVFCFAAAGQSYLSVKLPEGFKGTTDMWVPGDVNGDGIDEIIIGNVTLNGVAAVCIIPVWDQASYTTLLLPEFDAKWNTMSVDAADLDGDGFAEIIVGLPEAEVPLPAGEFPPSGYDPEIVHEHDEAGNVIIKEITWKPQIRKDGKVVIFHGGDLKRWKEIPNPAYTFIEWKTSSFWVDDHFVRFDPVTVGHFHPLGFGTAVTALDDINGDGIKEFAVSDANYQIGDNWNVGRVYVFLSPDFDTWIAMESPHNADGEWFGRELFEAFDLDGTGRPELMATTSCTKAGDDHLWLFWNVSPEGYTECEDLYRKVGGGLFGIGSHPRYEDITEQFRKAYGSMTDFNGDGITDNIPESGWDLDTTVSGVKGAGSVEIVLGPDYNPTVVRISNPEPEPFSHMGWSWFDRYVLPGHFNGDGFWDYATPAAGPVWWDEDVSWDDESRVYSVWDAATQCYVPAGTVTPRIFIFFGGPDFGKGM